MKAIHKSIKSVLGYEENISDEEFLNDWKKRSTHVCKPCWELKYCPYGPFVEQSPLLPITQKDAIEHNEFTKNILKNGYIGEIVQLTDEMKAAYLKLAEEAKKNPEVLAKKVSTEIFMEGVTELAVKEDKNLLEYLKAPESDFEKYDLPYLFSDTSLGESEIPEELLPKIMGNYSPL